MKYLKKLNVLILLYKILQKNLILLLKMKVIINRYRNLYKIVKNIIVIYIIIYIHI